MSTEKIAKPFGVVWLHVGIVSLASFVLSLVIPRVMAEMQERYSGDSHVSSLCAFVFNVTRHLQNHLIEYLLVLGLFSVDYAICKHLLSKKGGVIWSGIILLVSIALLVSAIVIAQSALVQ